MGGGRKGVVDVSVGEGIYVAADGGGVSIGCAGADDGDIGTVTVQENVGSGWPHAAPFVPLCLRAMASLPHTTEKILDKEPLAAPSSRSL